MKKIYKIALVLFIIFNIYMVSFSSEAATGDIWQIGKDFLDLGAGSLGDTFNEDGLKSTFSVIIDFLWGLGLLVIFISTVVLGIKYMLVNPDERSRIKQATSPYIIGVIVIFGATTIWKFLINILEGSIL